MEQINFGKLGQGDNIFVLIHAYPVSGKLFSKLEHFLPKGWTLLIPDLPGFGQSPKSDREVLEMDYLAKLIHDQMPDDYDKSVIGGVSMGGYITMAFAEQYPEVASAYILMNTRDTADADGGAGRKEVVKRIQLGEREEYIKELLPKLLGKTSLVNQDLVKQTLDLIKEASDDAIIQTSRGMGLRPDRSVLMSKIDQPILLLTGNEDKITGPEVMKEMDDRYSNSQYHEVVNAGHYAVFEQPVKVSKILSNFLSSLS